MDAVEAQHALSGAPPAEGPAWRQRVNRTFSRQGNTSSPNAGFILVCIGIIVGIGAILLLILLPLSFSGLEYYEFGFPRRKTTGAVATEKVFGSGGLHAIGPDYEFKKFSSDAHFERFDDVTVFASDRLQVRISCHFQYFIRKHQLSLLHKKYDIHYRPILKNNALDALKGAGTAFSTREYIWEREKVESTFFKAVRERLGGTCCEIDCILTESCVKGCKPYERCDESDWGLHAEVRFFQLSDLEIPDELNQRYLQALVLLEATETEKLKQQAQLIRKETDKQVLGYQNEAAEIRQNATAQSQLIHSRAEADSKAVLENARSTGLRKLYNDLGIVNEEQKASFDYLRTLRGNTNAHIAVDFQNLVMYPKKDY